MRNARFKIRQQLDSFFVWNLNDYLLGFCLEFAA